MPVLVIVGPPASGKTTLMRERADALRTQGHEPICLDYDLMAQAIGSQRAHGHAEHFTPVVQRMRGAAIRYSLQAAKDTGCWVLIVDSSPPEYRRKWYADAGAEVVTLEVDRAELHRRAAAERPPEWHRLIDEWAPRQEDAGESWAAAQAANRRPWPKRPAHRRGAHGHRYERLRRAFLADKSNCANCGRPFVLDAPCGHPRCQKRGTGCWLHPRYHTVQHLEHLVTGAPSLNVSTWAAWCLECNQSDGGKVGRARQRARAQDHNGGTVDLSW